jgi:hypothetical protein
MQTAFVYEINSLEDNSIKNWYQRPAKREDIILCEHRARWKETQLIQRMGLPLLYALQESNHDLVTPNGDNVESLDNCPVMYRCNVGSSDSVIDSIVNSNGHLLVSKNDNQMVDSWVDYVHHQFTKRKMGVISLTDLCDEHDDIITETVKPYQKDGKFFIKTLRKGFHGLHPSEDGFDAPIINILTHFRGKDIPLIISEPIELIEDDLFHQFQEYRCVVANNQVTSISRYLDYGSHQIPYEIRQFADKFVSAHQSLFPSIYVVDIGLEETKGPLVIECNSLPASGSYVQNHFAPFLTALISGLDVSKLKRIAQEIEQEALVLSEQQQELELPKTDVESVVDRLFDDLKE